MFVYHFADPDLRVETIFRKEGANSYKLLQTEQKKQMKKIESFI